MGPRAGSIAPAPAASSGPASCRPGLWRRLPPGPRPLEGRGFVRRLGGGGGCCSLPAFSEGHPWALASKAELTEGKCQWGRGTPRAGGSGSWVGDARAPECGVLGRITQVSKRGSRGGQGSGSWSGASQAPGAPVTSRRTGIPVSRAQGWAALGPPLAAPQSEQLGASGRETSLRSPNYR